MDVVSFPAGLLFSILIFLNVECDEVEEYIRGIAIGSLAELDNLRAITWDEVEEKTLGEPDLRRLMDIIQEGFPEDINDLDDHLKHYFKIRDKLTTVGGVILYKNRILIPTPLRTKV